MDEIIKQTDWYKEKHSYKANVIAYTMSVLFEYIRNNVKGFEVDFIRIWNLQKIYPELEQQLVILCTQVYEFITRSDRLTENVTQWCKQVKCWDRAKQYDWDIQPVFLSTLIEKEKIQSEEKTAKEERKVDNEVDILKCIMSAGKDYWSSVLEWGKTRNLLSDMELSILKLVVNMETTGRIPSIKQARYRNHL